jgi:hypothetical protein
LDCLGQEIRSAVKTKDENPFSLRSRSLDDDEDTQQSLSFCLASRKGSLSVSLIIVLRLLSREDDASSESHDTSNLEEIVTKREEMHLASESKEGRKRDTHSHHEKYSLLVASHAIIMMIISRENSLHVRRKEVV